MFSISDFGTQVFQHTELMNISVEKHTRTSPDVFFHLMRPVCYVGARHFTVQHTQAMHALKCSMGNGVAHFAK